MAEKTKNDNISIILTLALLAGFAALNFVVLTTQCKLTIPMVPVDCKDYPTFIRIMYGDLIIAGALIVYEVFKSYKK